MAQRVAEATAARERRQAAAAPGLKTQWEAISLPVEDPDVRLPPSLSVREPKPRGFSSAGSYPVTSSESGP
eukprot:4727068-Prymnesium_polylepis.1